MPEAPLCAMVKVDGAFVLMPIDEVTTMRPDLSKFTAAEAAKEAAHQVQPEDEDYKPPASSGQTKGTHGGAAPSEHTLKTVKVPLSFDSQLLCDFMWIVLRCSETSYALGGTYEGDQSSVVQVEVHRRENERQAAQRMRSFTHLREQQEQEPSTKLSMHMLAEGRQVLQGACKSLMQRFSGEVAMGLPAGEYLRLVSPATYARQHSACVLLPHHNLYSSQAIAWLSG